MRDRPRPFSLPFLAAVLLLAALAACRESSRGAAPPAPAPTDGDPAPSAVMAGPPPSAPAPAPPEPSAPVQAHGVEPARRTVPAGAPAPAPAAAAIPRPAAAAPAAAVVVPPDTAPPSPPAGLSATPIGEAQVAVTWLPSGDDVGVVGYELQQEGAAAIRLVATSATAGGLHAGARACFTVVALDAAGNRSAPSEPACAITPDLTPPGAPAELAARAVSDRRIDLRWKAARDNLGVTAYVVVRDGEEIAELEGLELDDEGRRPGTKACYVVLACDAAGNRSSPSAPACATTPDLTPPTPPGEPRAIAHGARSVEVQWTPAQDDVGVAAYELLVGGKRVAEVAETLATVKGLSPASEACVQVVARDAAGNRSRPSAPACATTAAEGTPAGPRRLRTATTAGRVALVWEPSSEPDVIYTVSWDTGGRIGSTRGTSFTVVGLSPGERRCFEVSAVDPAGKASPRSFQSCVAVPVE